MSKSKFEFLFSKGMDEINPIVLEFYQYHRDEENETLGQFLANYHSLWLKASDYGVTGAAAITNLIPYLPPEWQCWAVTLVPEYMDITFLGGTLYGDFRGFLATLSHQFFSIGAPPPGPHHMPEVQLPGLDVLPENPVPFIFQPFEPEPYEPYFVIPNPNPESPIFNFENFPSPPKEITPFDPYSGPVYPPFHDFIHGFLYPPTGEYEGEPSHLAQDGDDDKEAAPNTAENEELEKVIEDGDGKEEEDPEEDPGEDPEEDV